MEVVPMHQAKSSLSQLVNRVKNGEVVFIGAYGRPEAKIVPVDQQARPVKRIGVMAGQFVVPDDFDEPLPDYIVDEFYK